MEMRDELLRLAVEEFNDNLPDEIMVQHKPMPMM